MEKSVSESTVTRTAIKTMPERPLSGTLRPNKVTPAPAAEDDESSGERGGGDDNDDGEVSMLDFLNTEQDSDKDKNKAGTRSSTSKLKGLFSKKEKSEPKLARGKSAGIFGRKSNRDE